MTRKLADEVVDVEIIYKAIDLMLAKGLKAGDMKVSCGQCQNPGCCYQVTAAFVAEGLYIADRLKPDSNERTRLYAAGEKMESLTRDAHFATATPCPWLNLEAPIGKQCSIYDVRPLSCRKYFVVTPPEYCLPESVTTRVGVVNTTEIDIRFIQTMMSIQTRLFGLLTIGTPMMASAPRVVAMCAEALSSTDRLTGPLEYLASRKWVDLDHNWMDREVEELCR